MRRSDVELYVHGHCDGYYGGGWAALLSYKRNGCRALLAGSAAPVKSSVIELLAAIHGLEHLGKQDLIADVYTDSGYVYLGFEKKHHLEQWIRNGWKDAEGNPVVLKELWLRLRALVDRHAVRFYFVPRGSTRAQSKLVQKEAQSAHDQRAHFEHYNP